MENCPTCGQEIATGLPEFHGLVMDQNRGEMRWNGLCVAGMSRKQFAVASVLFNGRGRTLSKGAILDGVYAGMDEPELKIVDVFVCKLRKTMSVFGESGPKIVTVWGRGYRLEVPGAPVPGDPAAHAHDNALSAS
jgi:DNA-binding response OmpR family regulator